jgi:hypothetical protein
MAVLDLSRATWRKSSYSNGGGECVEATSALHAIAVRDSKAPERSVLMMTSPEWGTFIKNVKTGKFDL